VLRAPARGDVLVVGTYRDTLPSAAGHVGPVRPS
jgi:hypothetical protein